MHLHSRKCIWDSHLQNTRFVSASVSYHLEFIENIINMHINFRASKLFNAILQVWWKISINFFNPFKPYVCLMTINSFNRFISKKDWEHIFTFWRWFDRTTPFTVQDRNICGMFLTIRVIQGQHGHPQSRFKTNEMTFLASKWLAFLHFTWKYKELATRSRIVSIGKSIFIIIARKDSPFAHWDIVSLVTQFVKCKSGRTLIEGRRFPIDIRSSF